MSESTSVKETTESITEKSADVTDVKEQVMGALRTIYDPEIPVNIVELGLIYGVEVSEGCDVAITMTLTTPGCPVAQTFPGTIEETVRKLDDVNSVVVELVWEPPWTMERMSEAARLQLNML